MKTQIRIIRAEKESLFAWLRSCWRQRRLVWIFARRDLRVQYAQTWLGLLWVVLQPLAGLLVFSVFFGSLVKVDTGTVPYPLFAFSGMVSWYFFSYMISQGGASLINNAALIRKLAFPRIVLPLSRVLTGLSEFAVALLLLFILMILHGRMPGIEILALPIFILLNIAAGLAFAAALSAMTLRYRDFHHIIPYLVNFGIWVTPVFYPQTLIPIQWRFLLYLNPMAGIIEGFRWSLLGGEMPDPAYVFSFAAVLLFLFFSLEVFRRNEKRAADWV